MNRLAEHYVYYKSKGFDKETIAYNLAVNAQKMSDGREVRFSTFNRFGGTTSLKMNGCDIAVIYLIEEGVFDDQTNDVIDVMTNLYIVKVNDDVINRRPDLNLDQMIREELLDRLDRPIPTQDVENSEDTTEE